MSRHFLSTILRRKKTQKRFVFGSFCLVSGLYSTQLDLLRCAGGCMKESELALKGVDFSEDGI